MKCLIINGSPSKKYPWGDQITQSFTGQMVDEVRAEMARLGGVSFEEIRLSAVNLPYCRGCYNCFVKGEQKCPHAGFMDSVFKTMLPNCGQAYPV